MVKRVLIITFGFILSVFLCLLFLYPGKIALYYNQGTSHFRDIEVVIYGDSIVRQGNDWNSKLGRADVLNCGYSGVTTAYLRARLEEDVISYDPAYCLIWVGVNDIIQGRKVSVMLDDCQFMVNALESNGVTPVFVSVCPVRDNLGWNESINAWNAELREYSRETGLMFIDVHAVLTRDGELPEKYTVDGIHLNRKAYSAVAIVIKNALSGNHRALLPRSSQNSPP